MNRIYRMKNEEFDNQKILYKYNDTKYYIMDGNGINTYEEYFDKLWSVFNFSDIPKGWHKNYHTEDEYMTDAKEITAEKVVFVIMHYNNFFKENLKEKEDIEDYYENYLLPYWDSEVEQVVKDGRRKDFNIYLVCD